VFDGTAWVPAARTAEITGRVESTPAADQVILHYVATRDLTLPVDLAGSQAVAGVAATAQTDSDVRKNGASVGTMSFAESASVASFSAAAAVALTAGDVPPRRRTRLARGQLADVALSLMAALS
jgi:hypothetical protein